MIIMYTLLVVCMAAAELALFVRVMPLIRQFQSKAVSRLFLWGAIIPGVVGEVALVVFFIFNNKLGPPLQMLVVTVAAVAIGFWGGRILLRVAKPLSLQERK